MEIAEVLEKANNSAKSNQKIRDMSKNCPNLKGGRQGDVYIVRADTDEDIKKLEAIFRKNKNKMWSDFTFGSEFKERKTNQLASGNSKGSRHIFSGEGKVLFCEKAHPCAGGIIEANKPWKLTHPEHANFKFPAGRFVFFFQMDARKESEVVRVRD
jgi:hypothetical protein